ncbi:MAG: DEAD/DEAH box helicase [Elusimicrobia bacterium]|nr:DEAD/DEAH box helicase [Candidatus Obscuribacterium magneticum]
MGFTRFHLPPEIFQAITTLGFAEPTPVQAHVIPEALKGRDIRACAQTGTGKTLAFVVPIIDKIIKHPHAHAHRPNVLVVAPTRELAAQVNSVFHDLAKHTKIKTALILGGTSYHKQLRQIRSGAEVVVGTPGRLLDHLGQGTLFLRHIHTFVLDEADRMLDMGFLPDIRRIMSSLPEKRQTMLFSATFPPEIQQIVRQFLKDPLLVDLAPSTPPESVTQMVYPVSRLQKEALLQALLEVGNISSALIFCRTKHGADHLVRTLHRLGKSVSVIHSDRSQEQREDALRGFKERKFQILVATDIAARGIDVKDISHVINFDVPHHPEDYVHRIGRTGRVEAVGDAFTLVTPDEEQYLKRIENFIKKPIPRGVIPDFPYIVPPKLVTPSKSVLEKFGRFRRRFSTSRRGRFR